MIRAPGKTHSLLLTEREGSGVPLQKFRGEAGKLQGAKDLPASGQKDIPARIATSLPFGSSRTIPTSSSRTIICLQSLTAIRHALPQNCTVSSNEEQKKDAGNDPVHSERNEGMARDEFQERLYPNHGEDE